MEAVVGDLEGHCSLSVGYEAIVWSIVASMWSFTATMGDASEALWAFLGAKSDM